MPSAFGSEHMIVSAAMFVESVGAKRSSSETARAFAMNETELHFITRFLRMRVHREVRTHVDRRRLLLFNGWWSSGPEVTERTSVRIIRLPPENF